MDYSIVISKAAEFDIRKAFLWYEDQLMGLGNDFEKHFSDAVNSIQNNPVKIQIRYKLIRIFFLKKFPYGIHFKIEASEILIIAVFHTSINPQKWKKRE
ncbi:MAG: type II toxin-antitoxin system RelE/ParE family toxin [Deltaproteobacteria bacterium]|nr:MAG: type II toxin-antitoxin system RelE/ParE family toxin [Deltaproteobacteria bacterium]